MGRSISGGGGGGGWGGGQGVGSAKNLVLNTQHVRGSLEKSHP